MSMLQRLRASKRTLSTDENSDYRIKKLTKKTGNAINPITISRLAIDFSPLSSPSTPAFLINPKTHLATAKHARVLAISETERWFGKTIALNRQHRAVVTRTSPLANTDGDMETTEAEECGFLPAGGEGGKGAVPGEHEIVDDDGTRCGKGLGFLGQDGEVEM